MLVLLQFLRIPGLTLVLGYKLDILGNNLESEI